MRLLAWHWVAIYAIEDFLGAGLNVSPTFRTPHVTVPHCALDQLMTLLDLTPHNVAENPYRQN
ncbi:MAG: hypothetical protein U0990_11035 [Candidatus Nanopelagicales bacterium]|nr:hypothetical protein [Candidatus Nanopelagicales bacterium]MDZ4250601.1 hypothetical protein [Candidatus Nanopelagicales bacterium]